MYHRHFSDYIPQKKNPRYSIEYQGFFISRGDWIRTSDHTPLRGEYWSHELFVRSGQAPFHLSGQHRHEGRRRGRIQRRSFGRGLYMVVQRSEIRPEGEDDNDLLALFDVRQARERSRRRGQERPALCAEAFGVQIRAFVGRTFAYQLQQSLLQKRRKPAEQYRRAYRCACYGSLMAQRVGLLRRDAARVLCRRCRRREDRMALPSVRQPVGRIQRTGRRLPDARLLSVRLRRRLCLCQRLGVGRPMGQRTLYRQRPKCRGGPTDGPYRELRQGIQGVLRPEQLETRQPRQRGVQAGHQCQAPVSHQAVGRSDLLHGRGYRPFRPPLLRFARLGFRVNVGYGPVNRKTFKLI